MDKVKGYFTIQILYRLNGRLIYTSWTGSGSLQRLLHSGVVEAPVCNEFEREIIRDRVIAGIKAKREKTGAWGRRALQDELQEKIKEMVGAKQPIRAIARTLGISTRTVMKYKHYQ